MITKRIIPCLDIRNGRTVKGVRFENLRDAGDPVELAVRYEEEGADEIVFLDISATLEGREATVSLVSQIAKQLTIPFTIGGGIRSPEDASRLLNWGADKISLNSAAVENPDLITDMASAFGSQFVVVAIDYKFCPEGHQVATHGGTRLTPRLAMDWAKEVQDRGAGEILLTSMDHDGTNNGFDIEFLSSSSNALTIPVIASGGAGRINHFADLFQQTDVDAALAASVFHDAIFQIAQLKENLIIQNISVRL